MLMISAEFSGWRMSDLSSGMVANPVKGPFKIRIVKPEEKRGWTAECLNCGRWEPLKIIEKSTNIEDVKSSVSAMFVRQESDWSGGK